MSACGTFGHGAMSDLSPPCAPKPTSANKRASTFRRQLHNYDARPTRPRFASPNAQAELCKSPNATPSGPRTLHRAPPSCRGAPIGGNVTLMRSACLMRLPPKVFAVAGLALRIVVDGRHDRLNQYGLPGTVIRACSARIHRCRTFQSAAINCDGSVCGSYQRFDKLVHAMATQPAPFGKPPSAANCTAAGPAATRDQ
jgi:hypothetical protein